MRSRPRGHRESIGVGRDFIFGGRHTVHEHESRPGAGVLLRGDGRGNHQLARRVSDLRVAARSSAFQFNSKSHDAREIGAALNVKTVLEGSVRTAGRRVRVTVQLIDVDNGFQLWSDRYDREMDDIFALQDEISEHVVDALKVTLGTEAKEEMKRPTASVEAYQLYLKGLHNWYKRDTGSLQKAADFFEQAVAVDPDYALAHAGLVTSHCSLAFYGMEPALARARASAAAERAAALAPGSQRYMRPLACMRPGSPSTGNRRKGN